MASERRPRKTDRVEPAPAVDAVVGPPQPFRDFIGPARRRSDHPMVVGTIVICCGFIAIGSVVQVGATLWAGWQVRVLIEKDEKRDEATDIMRKSLIEHSKSQAAVLRSVCFNVARSEKDRADCSIPEITPKGH